MLAAYPPPSIRRLFTGIRRGWDNLWRCAALISPNQNYPFLPVRVNGPNRHLRNFTLATFSVAIALLSWGAFVTSIDAGMAVPDWPTSFDSYDPFNPWPGWWTVTPVLAEHGHRLLGALVGFMTLVLAFWTWRSESRVWMRRLGFGALALVILQGLLGGLRVLWVSLDLAVVHACVAQLFFALLASMILFQTESWCQPRRLPSLTKATKDHILWIAPVAVYFQIIFGALLRHPGTGIDTTLVATHLGWAFVATAMIVALVVRIRSTLPAGGLLGKLSASVSTILTVQVALGLIAYFVLLDETGRTQPSNVQVLANTAHMVIGALLFASTVVLAVLATRVRSFSAQSTA